MKKLIILCALLCSFNVFAEHDAALGAIKVCSIENDYNLAEGYFYVQLNVIRVADGDVVRKIRVVQALTKLQALEVLNSQVCN